MSFLAKVGRAFTNKKHFDLGEDREQESGEAAQLPVAERVEKDLEGDSEALSPVNAPPTIPVGDNTRGRPGRRSSSSATGTLASLLRSLSPSRIPASTVATDGTRRNDNDGSSVPRLSLYWVDEGLKESQTRNIRDDGGQRADSLEEKKSETRRLDITQTLRLVNATTGLLKERGLRSLGLFKPYWHSSSGDAQAVLIDLFISTLPYTDAPDGNKDVFSKSPDAQTRFITELGYSQSMHDVAAVLKWAFRHLKLGSQSFGLISSEEDQFMWYKEFASSERASGYPLTAYTTFLIPLLSEENAELLKVALDLISSVAAHSDEVAISGNKLAKIIGWWLLSNRLTTGAEVSKGKEASMTPYGWMHFYGQWEKSARVMEHLFLAFLRDLSTHSKLPKRLSELISKYPYEKSAELAEGIFLPKPRFSTRTLPAFFVQLKEAVATGDGGTELVEILDPIKVLEGAFLSDYERSVNDSEIDQKFCSVWDSLKQDVVGSAGNKLPDGDGDELPEEGDSAIQLKHSQLLSDETLRVLSQISSHSPATKTPDGPNTPRVPPSRSRTEFSLSTPHFKTSRSLSFDDAFMDQSPTPHIQSILEQNTRAATDTGLLESPLSPFSDWRTFNGFSEPRAIRLAETLNSGSSAVSASVPAPPPSAWTKKMSGMRRQALRTHASGTHSQSPSRRTSADISPSTPTTPTLPLAVKSARCITYPAVVQLDEAFVDVWADTLSDRTLIQTEGWPNVVICQLRKPVVIDNSPSLMNDTPNEVNPSTSFEVGWIIVEQVREIQTQSPPLEQPATKDGSRPTSPTSPGLSADPGKRRVPSVTKDRLSKVFRSFAKARSNRTSLPASTAYESDSGEMGPLISLEEALNTDKGSEPMPPGRSTAGPINAVVEANISKNSNPQPDEKQSDDLNIGVDQVDLGNKVRQETVAPTPQIDVSTDERLSQPSPESIGGAGTNVPTNESKTLDVLEDLHPVTDRLEQDLDAGANPATAIYLETTSPQSNDLTVAYKSTQDDSTCLEPAVDNLALSSGGDSLTGEIRSSDLEVVMSRSLSEEHADEVVSNSNTHLIQVSPQLLDYSKEIPIESRTSCHDVVVDSPGAQISGSRQNSPSPIAPTGEHSSTPEIHSEATNN